jgi:hypothetical protein
MELRIGVVHTAKELSLEVDGKADDVVGEIERALDQGAKVVWLTDARGRRVGVASEKIAYIEVDEDSANKHVGFGR